MDLHQRTNMSISPAKVINGQNVSVYLDVSVTVLCAFSLSVSGLGWAVMRTTPESR